MWYLITILCFLVITSILWIIVVAKKEDFIADKIFNMLSLLLTFVAWFCIGASFYSYITPSAEDYNRGKVDTIIKYEVVNNDTISCDTIYKLKQL